MRVTTCSACGNDVWGEGPRCPRCGQAVARRWAGTRGAARPLPLIPLAIFAAGALALAAVLLLARHAPPAGEALAPEPAPASRPEPVPMSRPEAAPTARLAAPADAARVPERTPSGGALAPPVAPTAALPRPTPTPPVEQVYECRLGAIFGVDPEEAIVTVDGAAIGTADEWDDAGGGKKYPIERPGTHYVRFTLNGYRTAWIKIVVRPNAAEEYAEVDLELKKLGEDD